MIIACPECSGKFRIDPSALGATGRTVRCSKCASTWLQMPPDPADETAREEPAGPGPTTAPPPARDAGGETGEMVGDDDGAGDAIGSDAQADLDDEPAVRRRRRARAAARPAGPGKWPVIAAWTALVVAVGALGVGLVAFRDSIMNAWPETNALYDPFDLARPGYRLVLATPRWRQERIDGAAALIVEGEITNPTDRERPVPKLLKLQLLDATRSELQARTFPSPVQVLPPRRSAAYKMVFTDPAEDSDELRITFVVDE